MYLLDTNTCIYFLNGKFEKLQNKFIDIEFKEIFLCSIVKGELLYGAVKSSHPKQNIEKFNAFAENYQSIPFDEKAIEHYAQIKFDLQKKGTPIGANDLFIAAIALANDLTLVTHNKSEFGRVTNLKIVDWVEE